MAYGALRRYVQLPINAGMREAWEPSWQSVRPAGAPPSDAATLNLPVSAAAAQLGLGVFASGPLGEGSLLKDRQLLVCACSTTHCNPVPAQDLQGMCCACRVWPLSRQGSGPCLASRAALVMSDPQPLLRTPCNMAALLTQDRLGQFPQLSHIQGEGAQLLQLARSTPYVICALVGHKTPAHVDENLALTQVRIPICPHLSLCTAHLSQKRAQAQGRARQMARPRGKPMQAPSVSETCVG